MATYRVGGAAGMHQLGYGLVSAIEVVGAPTAGKISVQGGGGGKTIPAGSAVGAKFGLPSGAQLHKNAALQLIFDSAADFVDVHGDLFSVG